MVTILIIDDSAEHRQMVTETLTEDGHAVVATADGVDGLSAFNTTDFDLVITDILMPKADGIEVIRGILDSGKSVPIIAMSGGGTSFPAALSLSASRAFGAAAVLFKPFRATELREAVARALAS